MSVTYAVSDAATTFQVSFRAIGPTLGLYQYNTRRGYLKFDTSVILGGVESAELILVCATVIGGGGDTELHSGIGASGWGAALDATTADFSSTNTVLEDTVSVTTTGTKIYTVSPSSLDLSGTTYLRLRMLLEGEQSPYSKGATYASQDHGTAANRPVLRIVTFTGQVIFVNAF